MAVKLSDAQRLCPKCGRMYCEGYWGRGVCIADMSFGYDATANGDAAAEYLRVWYEANRESWWERVRPGAFWRRGTADNFMLGLIEEVSRIERERLRQAAGRAALEAGGAK